MTNKERKLLTIKQFCKPGQWPSESSIRQIILDLKKGKKDFQSAFFWVGQRILIDPVEFHKCIDKLQNHNKV